MRGRVAAGPLPVKKGTRQPLAKGLLPELRPTAAYGSPGGQITTIGLSGPDALLPSWSLERQLRLAAATIGQASVPGLQELIDQELRARSTSLVRDPYADQLGAFGTAGGLLALAMGATRGLLNVGADTAMWADADFNLKVIALNGLLPEDSRIRIIPLEYYERTAQQALSSFLAFARDPQEVLFDPLTTVVGAARDGDAEALQTLGEFGATVGVSIAVLPFLRGSSIRSFGKALGELGAVARRARLRHNLARLEETARLDTPAELTEDMPIKALYGALKKGSLVGAHSPRILDSKSIGTGQQLVRVTTLDIGFNGTRNVNIEVPHPSLPKLIGTRSVLYPEAWTDELITEAALAVSRQPATVVRISDQATLHQAILDGVQVNVIVKNDRIVSHFPSLNNDYSAERFLGGR